MPPPLRFADLDYGERFRFLDGTFLEPHPAVCVKVNRVRYRYAGDGWRYYASPDAKVERVELEPK